MQKCKPIKEDERREGYKRYDKERDKTIKGFYSSSQWIKLRDVKRQLNPLCEHCLANDELTPVAEIDHIVPIRIDWSKRLELSNTQSLCRCCHAKKTAEDKKKYKL